MDIENKLMGKKMMNNENHCVLKFKIFSWVYLF